MPRLSAGLLVYREGTRGAEVLLVHPGGPFWARRDAGAWSIPKGEHGPEEDPAAVAEREFREELGKSPPAGARRPLGEVVQAGGKRVAAWAVAGDLDVTAVHSNTFEIEWPRGSGHRRRFPEIDRAGWFSAEEAEEKLVAGQRPLLDRLGDLLAGS